MPLFNPGILATGGSVTGNLTVTGNEAVSGTATVSGNVAAATNLLVGSTTPLGDNGTGELQIANVTSAPTTNPTGGITAYALSGAPYARDPQGNVWTMISPPGEQSYPTPGAIAETCHRYTVSGSSAPTSGVLTIGSIFLTAGQAINHLGFGNGATATTAASHWWLAILDNTYKQLSHTADQLTTNIAASTWYNLATTATFTAAYTGNYYLGIMIAVSSGSVASILSPTFTSVAQLVTGTNVPTPLVGGASTTGLTGPGTDGVTTYSAPTAATPTYYMYAAA
jgi:hypothetical protein